MNDKKTERKSKMKHTDQYYSWIKNVDEQIRCIPLPPTMLEFNSRTDFPSFNFVSKELGIAVGPVTLLCAYSNSGKSYVAAEIAVSVANNLKMFGKFDVSTPGPVLHIDFEAGKTLVETFYHRIANGHKLLKTGVAVDYPEWRLNDAKQIAAARDTLLAQLCSYKLCIIDCLSAAAPRLMHNEESAREPLDMLSNVSTETGCSILLLHHTAKIESAEQIRKPKGSGAIIAAAGSSLSYYREEGSNIAKLIKGKIRVGQPFEREIEYKQSGVWVESIDSLSDVVLTALDYVPEISIDQQILTYLSTGPKTASQIESFITCRKGDVIAVRQGLIKDGMIVETREGKSKLFSLTDGGQVEQFSNQKEIARAMIDERQVEEKISVNVGGVNFGNGFIDWIQKQDEETGESNE